MIKDSKLIQYHANIFSKKSINLWKLRLKICKKIEILKNIFCKTISFHFFRLHIFIAALIDNESFSISLSNF